jgi:alpha-glucosidase (family GH31 glycosyl hydrolase)
MRPAPVTILAVTCALAAAAARAVEPPEVTVRTGGGRVRVSSGAAVVEASRSRFRLRLRAGGRTLEREQHPGLFYERGGTQVDLLGVEAATPLPDGVRLRVATSEGVPATVTLRFLTSRTLEVALDPPDAPAVTAAGERLRSPKHERIYGLTERLRDSPPFIPGLVDQPVDDLRPPEAGSLDRRGETVEMRILPTFSLYAPFYHSSRGYGLAVAGTTFGLFDLAESDPSTVRLRFETGTTPDSRRFVLRFFVGPDPLTILDEYTHLVGRPLVPPDWAFLHWRWRGELRQGLPAQLDGVEVNADLADDVTMYDMLGIPAGVYLFDRPVLVGPYGFDRWEWDTTRMPNPEAMLASLARRGYRTMIWSAAWACGSDPGDHGLEAQALGYLAPRPGGGTLECGDGGGNFVLDVTNPGAQAWWRDKIAEFVRRWGIQGIKLDRGEEHIPSEATDVWADGRTGREVRNDYPTLQAKIHHDALASAHPDGDFVLFSRPGYSGTQRWSIFWGGDISASETFGTGPGTDLGLRSAIISQQRAAYMGIPIWGSDVGGYYQFKDREVFARWIEFGAFSGIMEIGGVGTHAPWDMPTAPAYDAGMIDIYRRYVQLRHRLQPYIVAAAREAAWGVPLVRPMRFADRRDRKLEDLWDQYLFGPDLLVAPVWRVGQRQRSVYLPAGTWRSYWDPSRVWKGKRTITVDVPLDAIPVFVRDGAVVPGP